MKNSYEPPFVAVRSSATTEDLADASFAGQQETFLNIKGASELIESIKKCFASLFTARAIYYRAKKGFAHEKSYLAVVVQKMINADKSGVMFSKNPLNDSDEIVIEAVFGLGEGIVSGRISPDNYIVNRALEVVSEKIADKKIALTRNSSGRTETIKLRDEISKREVLSKYELKVLAQYALRLEEHYKKPQDIEFAIADGEIYIVQSRPITTKAKKEDKEVEGNVLLKGMGASPGIASGSVRVIRDMDDLDKVQRGNILVTKMTSPDMVVSMQKASGIITDEGGITSHAAIVSREMGIPAVVGTRDATEKLKDGQIVTVDGYTGRIIEGEGIEKKAEIKPIINTKTEIKVIVDLPDYAKRASESGCKSAGLVRLEAVIASFGKHPVWYIKNDRIEEYIKNIYEGLRKIALPFQGLWIRTSDIRSDEYRNLEGAPNTQEGNPMLGDHGIRFSLRNQELFEAEIQAIKELADEYGNKKVGIMFPQVVSVDEVKEASKILKKVNVPENVSMGIMVETPASVQIINSLCEEGIKFISIGSNDLTQYTLAVDRNNENVQDIYDEMNQAVLNSISYVLRRCQKYGVKTSICGQAGSKKEMVKFLVENGIDSISVNADAAHDVSILVAEIEKLRIGGNSYESSIFNNYPKERAVEVSNTSKNYSEKSDSINEEDLILKALEEEKTIDEYNPGDKKASDVPPLNEAIPVESDDFINNTESLGNFEEQEEKVFEAEIQEEIEKSEQREEAIKQYTQEQEWPGKKGKSGDSLDIF